MREWVSWTEMVERNLRTKFTNEIIELNSSDGSEAVAVKDPMRVWRITLSQKTQNQRSKSIACALLLTGQWWCNTPGVCVIRINQNRSE